MVEHGGAAGSAPSPARSPRPSRAGREPGARIPAQRIRSSSPGGPWDLNDRAMGFLAHSSSRATSVNLYHGFKVTGNFTTVDLIPASTNSLSGSAARAIGRSGTAFSARVSAPPTGHAQPSPAPSVTTARRPSPQRPSTSAVGRLR